MALALPSNSRVAHVNVTFLRLIAPTLARGVQLIACRLLVFQGKPVGRLALFHYLRFWIFGDRTTVLVWIFLSPCPRSRDEGLPAT